MQSIFDFRGIFTNINTRTVYLYSIFIGALAGLGALAFSEVLTAVIHLTMGQLANISIPQPQGEADHLLLTSGEINRWWLFFLPILGGLVSGLFVKTFAPEAEGTGTDGYIYAFHNMGGMMRARVPLVKSLATIATLCSGGSAGKEGPVAQIGSGIGSILGKYIGMGARARRTMLVAGAAGGLGAIFRAPLGGALTAVEVLYKEDLETDALTPCILSSVTAYTLFCSIKGFSHVFSFNYGMFHNPAELAVYAVLGLLCSGVGYLYVRFFHGVKRQFFDRLPINKYFVPAVGGMFVGTIGLFFPQVLGQGFGYLQQAINGDLASTSLSGIGLLATLAMLKIATTSFTIASGGSGGVFAPSLYIGGMLGGCVGTLAHHFFPGMVPHIAPYVVVGMGAFFAGVANAPIASLLMVCELTGAYELLPPLMLVATISLITSRRWSIYFTQVDNKFYSKAHLWEMNPDILKRLTIGEAFKGNYRHEAVVSSRLTLDRIEALARDLGQHNLIVEDDKSRLGGLIELKNLYHEKDLSEISQLIIAHDLINRKPFWLTPADSLIRALEVFADNEFDKIPVVTRQDGSKKLLGYIEYRDILKFYELEQGRPCFGGPAHRP